MRGIEKILREADFAKETNFKNMLFYELFKKNMTVQESKEDRAKPGMLSAEALAMVSGGGKNEPGANTNVFTGNSSNSWINRKK